METTKRDDLERELEWMCPSCHNGGSLWLWQEGFVDRLQHLMEQDNCSGYGTMQKATCHRFLRLMGVDTHCTHISVYGPPVS